MRFLDLQAFPDGIVLLAHYRADHILPERAQILQAAFRMLHLAEQHIGVVRRINVPNLRAFRSLRRIEYIAVYVPWKVSEKLSNN